jgi:hypothetical protein
MFYEMQRSFWLAEELVDFQEEPFSVKLVSCSNKINVAGLSCHKIVFCVLFWPESENVQSCVDE